MKQSLLFVLTLLTVAANADESGRCTPGVYYSYNSLTHTLAVNGNGMMKEMLDNSTGFKVLAQNDEIQIKRTIHVEQAGTLPNLISNEEKYKIAELTLTGEINGTDIHFIRDMAGVNMDGMENELDYRYLETNGVLRCLDLSGVKIVEGGRDFYREMTSSGRDEWFYIHTEKDVISRYMFLGCNALKEIILPKSITKIEVSQYNHVLDINLKQIIIAEGNAKYDSRDNCNAIIEKETNKLIIGGYSSTIPNNVVSIGDGAFSGCKSLTSITIPNSVTSIGRSAFSGCSSLASVTIGNSVTSIGKSAFYGCSSLASVTIGNSVTSIGNDAFRNCSGLTSVTIGNSVTSIGNEAFRNCSGLTSVTIPNSVTSIGNGAFNGCTGLTSITIPNSVTSIGSFTFSDCSGIESIQVDSNNMFYDSRNNCNAIIDNNNQLIVGCKNTIIPNSVISIGEYAFYGCTGLTSINIPNNVTSIGNYSFYYCRNLVYVNLPGTLYSIGNFAFWGCNRLTDIYCKTQSVPSTGQSSFPFSNDITLHVPNTLIDTYKKNDGWNIFKMYVSYDGSDIQDGQRCSKPTINVKDGSLVFSCETPYVSYRWSITPYGGNQGYAQSGDTNISLPITLYVFATKYGYENSEVTTYTFPSIAGDVDGNGVINAADHVKLSEIILNKNE